MPPGYPFPPPHMGFMMMPGMMPPMPMNPQMRPMMPMHPGMMPPIAQSVTAIPPTTQTIIKVPSPSPQKHTTVYVGKIAASVEDDFLHVVLQQCGSVTSWKRVTGLNNTQRAFGFCEYESAEGVLTALRILNGYVIDGDKLLLKVDDKTQSYLDGYEKVRKTNQTEGEDEKTKREEEDKKIKAKIEELIEDRKNGVFQEKHMPKQAVKTIQVEEGELIAGHEIDKHKAVLVSQEIKNFRDRQAEKDKEKKMRGDGDRKTEISIVERELERERRERDRERHKVREERRISRGRDMRTRERKEQEFRKREREWLLRETKRIREKARREKEEERERIKQIEREMSDEKRKRRRRRREREKEEKEDELDREKEIQEERMRLEKLEQEKIIAAGTRAQADAAFANGTETDNGNSLDNRINKAKKLGFGLGGLKRPLSAVTPGFIPHEETNPLPVPKKPKLTPLAPMKTEEQVRKEREEEARAIVQTIPTKKEELFVFPMDWDIVDESNIVTKRMKPWVTKKIVEYLGEEEPSLINFIVRLMSNHNNPQEILTHLAYVLDEEAEVFVIKLWRMLIFEMIRAQKEKERAERGELY
eukprot:CAMPEP_0174275112 /NCGR_PEP_ID=MMETSP0439-20130205/59651_1 /TAXON_ID=0 /ORGANISM="Stereomyxa ramosa, Strain Chinc5" /LENGTH=587 /DNA_ID=CAMNT_0015367191 /DNA_START=8 /DNA_END=1771 /DNA_ORIENTATION=+